MIFDINFDKYNIIIIISIMYFSLIKKAVE